jgi:predicted SnoaL-like aldol condensation-catalyzing enzyme
MGEDENKALVRRFVDEVFEKLHVAAVDELVADEFVSHTWPSSGDGKADLKAATERMASALSDIDF